MSYKNKLVRTCNTIFPEGEQLKLGFKDSKNLLLFEGIQECNPYKVRRAIKEGANVNYISPRSGLGMLHNAIIRGDPMIVHLLLKFKADPNLKDKAGLDPLTHSVICNNLEMCQHLINAGADVLATDPYMRTALMRAAHQGNPYITYLLLEKGAEVNARDYMKKTPLMYGAMGGNLDTILVLLHFGANSRLKSSEGYTASTYAEQFESFEACYIISDYSKLKKAEDFDAVLRFYKNSVIAAPYSTL